MTFFNPILNILVIIVLIYTLNYTFVGGLFVCICMNVFANADADANIATVVFRLRTLRFDGTVENSIFSFNKDICKYRRPGRAHSLTHTNWQISVEIRFQNVVYVFIHIVHMCDVRCALTSFVSFFSTSNYNLCFSVSVKITLFKLKSVRTFVTRKMGGIIEIEIEHFAKSNCNNQSTVNEKEPKCNDRKTKENNNLRKMKRRSKKRKEWEWNGKYRKFSAELI